MKKIGLFIIILSVLMTASACGASDTQVSLDNTITTPDGSFTITTPDDWAVYDDASEDYFLMTISDNNTASANIFFFSNEGDDYTAKDYAEEMTYYYDGNIIDETKEIEADNADGYVFEYSMVDIGDDGEDYNFYGYEFFFDMPSGVVEIDIYYSQSKIESKLFKPSDSQLALLTEIAKSIREK